MHLKGVLQRLIIASALLVMIPAQLLMAQGSASVSVPSPAEVLGHELGEKFTDHRGVVRYFEALAEHTPMVRIERYGETIEGRPLLQVVIGREDYLSRLDEILDLNRELAEPTTSLARAREIAESNPAILYFSYGIHGNESSSSEASLWTAWDLIRGSGLAAGVLDSAIVIIDPAVNPDGRDRYVNWYNQMVGLEPNPNPNAAEHWEPWPGGRFNHYLFDLNRDWAWISQPESKARIATWGRWTPQVHIDFHEMSPNSTYFFFPAAKPISPIYPEHTLKWGKIIGEANARAFDERGWAYYTGQVFDLFYPGYGDSWPSLLGAIGMTYEQSGGGRAGLAFEREDGTILTLRHRAEGHRTSGLATARVAATRKTELLLGFAEFHRTIGEDTPDVLLVPGENRARVDALVEHLRGQGIRVEEASRTFRVRSEPHYGFEGRSEFPAGTYRVPARQSRGRLAAALLQPEVFLDATFSYDLSAWSLPYAYGVEAHSADRVPDAGWEVVEDLATTSVVAAPSGGVLGSEMSNAYGFLIEPSFDIWPEVVSFLLQGGMARVMDGEFTLEGKEWPRGTVFIPRLNNPGLVDKLEESGLAGRVTPVSTGFSESGIDLGSNDAYDLQLPRVAVLNGEGVSATSYGAHWFFLERTVGLPFDAIPLARLGAVSLQDYDILVIPDLGRGASLGEREIAQINDWVRGGGTLIAVAGGARATAGPIAGIELRSRDNDDDPVESALRGRKARELTRWEQQIPGTIFSLNLDAAHPISFGAGVDGQPDRLFQLHTGGGVFEPDPAYETVAYFPGELEKASGVISEENLEYLEKGSAIALRRLGRGKAILFTDDPVFRHFWYGTFQLYMNALMIGPKL